MCVIATGIKKDFAPAWFEACCKHNPHGFFVSRVNRAQYIRTLDMAEAQKFFDESDENDQIVLHARIKSVGEVNLENTHGWAAKGLQFCHNGTLGSITAEKGKTDSETFFRKVLLPAYQANNKRIGSITRGAIEACIGGSRFLVIRNKKVYLFGEYKEKGKCKFSNLHWDIPKYDGTSWYKSYYGAKKTSQSLRTYDDFYDDEPDLGYGAKSRQKVLQERKATPSKVSVRDWTPPTATQSTKAEPPRRSFVKPRAYVNAPDGPDPYLSCSGMMSTAEQMTEDELFDEAEKILAASEYARHLEYYYSPIQGDYVKNPHYNPMKSGK